jgi:hypothetical protein
VPQRFDFGAIGGDQLAELGVRQVAQFLGPVQDHLLGEVKQPTALGCFDDAPGAGGRGGILRPFDPYAREPLAGLQFPAKCFKDLLSNAPEWVADREYPIDYRIVTVFVEISHGEQAGLDGGQEI